MRLRGPEPRSRLLEPLRPVCSGVDASGPTKWENGLPNPAQLPVIAGRATLTSNCMPWPCTCILSSPPRTLTHPRRRASRRAAPRSRCLPTMAAKCHDPDQGYTNNKLARTPAFGSPKVTPRGLTSLPSRSGRTRPWPSRPGPGTALYKVPTLKGVWYRGPLEHNGSVGTLEDWFDPQRLEDGYVPTGWKGRQARKPRREGARVRPRPLRGGAA